jgi:hypothetical protein
MRKEEEGVNQTFKSSGNDQAYPLDFPILHHLVEHHQTMVSSSTSHTPAPSPSPTCTPFLERLPSPTMHWAATMSQPTTVPRLGPPPCVGLFCCQPLRQAMHAKQEVEEDIAIESRAPSWRNARWSKDVIKLVLILKMEKNYGMRANHFDYNGMTSILPL